MQKHSISAFIEKTWTMLEGGEYEEVICWNEEGDSFTIIDQVEFEKVVLPIYFKHSNLTSFQRQLNMYNFHKRKSPLGQTVYYHRLFRQHQRDLLRAIRRKPSEDQIEIGEELLRKLMHQHEQTHHDIPHGSDQQNSIENKSKDNPQQALLEAPIQPQFFSPLPYYFPDVIPQMMWFFMHPQDPPMIYNPERIINTHILINTPQDAIKTQ